MRSSSIPPQYKAVLIPQVIQLKLLENKNTMTKWEMYWHQGIICFVCCLYDLVCNQDFPDDQNDLTIWIFFLLPFWAWTEKYCHAHSSSVFYVKSSLAYLHTFHFVCMSKNENINTTLVVVSYVNIFIYFSIIAWICICFCNYIQYLPKMLRDIQLQARI